MSAGNKQVSTTDGDDKPVKAADHEQSAAPQSNFERLLLHLAKDSLAGKLVFAFAKPSAVTPTGAVAKVAADRLDELKRNYDKSQDQQD